MRNFQEAMQEMNNLYNALTSRGLERDVRQVCGRCWQIFPLVAVTLLVLSVPVTHAQTTAQLTGTVEDVSAGVIPGAQVTLINESTASSRVVQTNGEGLYAFPALVPGSYTSRPTRKVSKAKKLPGSCCMLETSEPSRRLP